MNPGGIFDRSSIPVLGSHSGQGIPGAPHWQAAGEHLGGARSHSAEPPGSGCGTKSPNRVPGRARPLCLTTSDVDFLGDFEGVIDLNTEITHRAVNLGMAKRLGFILRISYLIESQRSAARRSVLAAVKRSSCRRKKSGQPS